MAYRLREEFQRMLAHFERAWTNTFRFVDRARFDYDPYQYAHILTISYRNGFHVRHLLTFDEMRMDPLGAAEDWLRNIERSIARYCEENEPIRRREFHQARVIADDGRLTIEHLDRAREALLQNERQWRNEYLRTFGGFFAEEIEKNNKKDREADEKAKALFKSVAGENAFNILESGRGVQLKGSLGTEYHLFKKASFCITRPSDGARLCAVVPGVPLWDHLLGIKLMVENDEPLFLKTANVSGGLNNEPNMRLGEMTWFDETSHIPASAFRRIWGSLT